MIHRFQIYFPLDLFLRLKTAAARSETSIADFIRKAVERTLTQEGGSPRYGKDALDGIVGKCRSRESDLSYNHDKYLYGRVKDSPRHGRSLRKK